MIDLLTRSKSRQRQRQLETENASLREEIEFLRSRMYSNGETKADKLNQLMNLENQSLKSGLTDIQSSLAQCVNFSKENLNDVNAASESFESIVLRVESVLSDMASVTAQVETSDSTVKSMLEDTEAITEALSLIKTIANQTNLISLNAAVEAARAGESGLGFAIVSNEVKNLSEKTQLALQEIDRVISSIVSNVKDIAQSNAEICDLTLCVQGNINEFGDTTLDLGESLNTRSDSVSRIADEVFLSLAKLDHMIWMVNCYLSVNIGEPAIPLVDHHSCRLGQWYEQGEGKDFFSH